MKKFLLIAFCCFCCLHLSAQFQNPFSQDSGYIVSIYESNDESIFIITGFGGQYYLSKIAKNGERLHQVSLDWITSEMTIDWITQIEDTVVVAFTMIDTNNQVFQQVFRFYDNNLNAFFSEYQTITDTRILSHPVWYRFTPERLWSGFVHNRGQLASIDAIEFNTKGQMVKRKSVDSLTNHGKYSKLFRTHDGYKLFYESWGQYFVYTLDNEFSVLSKDSFIPRHESEIWYGCRPAISRCSGMADIIQLNDSLYLAQTTCTINRKTVGALYLIANDTIAGVEAAKTNLGGIHNAVLLDDNYRGISRKESYTYILSEYRNSVDYSQYDYLLQFSNRGAYQKGYKLWLNSTQFEDITMILALHDGGCLLAGVRDYKIYLAKLDTNGLITYNSEISQATYPSIRLYPNPGANTIEGLNNIQSIILIDLQGIKHQTSVISGQADVSMLKSGLYTVFSIDNNEQQTFMGKWVKQ